MSDILFARPSLLEGVGRAVDLFGVLQIYNISATPEEADDLAILSDWATVGDDFRRAMKSFENGR